MNNKYGNPFANRYLLDNFIVIITIIILSETEFLSGFKLYK